MKTTRRQWMTGALGLGLAVPAATLRAVTEPYARSGSSLRVGLAAYSFRHYFKYSRGKVNERLATDGPAMDMLDFIRYCARHGVDGAELTSYYFAPDATLADFTACRREAHLNGVAIVGTAVGNNFSHPDDSPEREVQLAHVREWIDKAVWMGAPHIRVFAGVHPKGMAPEQAEEQAIKALRELAPYAGERGVFLGLENHDSVATAERLLHLVKSVDSPWVGVNLDSGNFIADDPYAEIEACAPYAVNFQLKTEMGRRGNKTPADMARIIDILKKTGYAGHVVLEYEEENNPYEAVPPLLEKLKYCIHEQSVVKGRFLTEDDF